MLHQQIKLLCSAALQHKGAVGSNELPENGRVRQRTTSKSTRRDAETATRSRPAIESAWHGSREEIRRGTAGMVARDVGVPLSLARPDGSGAAGDWLAG